MDTPIYDFLNSFNKGEISRFFMPGHKGNHPYEVLGEMSRLDITEIEGADSLFEADGIINRSEMNAARLYDSQATCFSAGGSTLSIMAMVALVAKENDCIIAARNSHLAFINACSLIGVTPCWVKPQYNDSFGVSGEILPDDIERAIVGNKNARAVYITSPDYLGCMSDVKAIAEICKRHDVPLLVDNAHGAHLKFMSVDRHPLTLGATLCCDSAHKTLPVFTGGGYLHSAKGSGFTAEKIKEKMKLFGSTSPSYLIMLSLDLNNKYLAERAKIDFAALENEAENFWSYAGKKGFKPISKQYDITKLTLDGYAVGMTGGELADYLRERKIECEYSGSRHAVLMISPQNRVGDFERLKAAIDELPKKALTQSDMTEWCLPVAKMTPRQALMSESERVDIDSAVGRISAETMIKCPPGVPVVICGEVIDEYVKKLLKKSSISSLNVVK